MSSFEAETPSDRANCTNTGIITTTTGVFDTTALDNTTKSISSPMASFGLVRALRSARLVNASSAPVRTSAPITMNIAAMVHGAGFDSTCTAPS